MKTVEVVAAVITKDNKVFATQRGYGEFKGYWEFPGGKIEPGEDHRQALVREIKEELNSTIAVDSFITSKEHTYPNLQVTLYFYQAHLKEGNLDLLEHMDAKWVDASNIEELNWLEADREVIKQISFK